jgi:hypothetical protein
MPAPKLCEKCKRRPAPKGERVCPQCRGEIINAIRERAGEYVKPPRTLSRIGTEAAGRRIPRSFQAIAGSPQDWPEGE